MINGIERGWYTVSLHVCACVCVCVCVCVFVWIQGECIELKQKPLQVKFIEDMLKEQKTIVLYLCKE